MAVPLLTKAPSDSDTAKFCLAMSTFRDGSGQEREPDGSTRPGWREFERIVAEVLGGYGPESKAIFDVIVSSNTEPVDYGISVKSKQLSSKDAIPKLAADGRVYMELTNSPAKLWDPIKNHLSLNETHFANMQEPQAIGESILKTVESWHLEGKKIHEATVIGRQLDLKKSVFLTISYGKFHAAHHRDYQIHTFDLSFPNGITWKYKSGRCLSGYDPAYPKEVLMDWYALSGGQLKYYPRATSSRYRSPIFRLLKPKTKTILENAKTYFPSEWEQKVDIQ